MATIQTFKLNTKRNIESKNNSVTLSKEKNLNSRNIMDDQTKSLVKKTLCHNFSEAEFDAFIYICEKSGLDPLTKQIYAIPRGQGQYRKIVYQTSIDGLRLIADRTEAYAPGKSEYHYDDKGNLLYAESIIKKRTSDGAWHEVSACAFLSEYKPTGNNTFWAKMPHVMLAKVAEANALRRAFPQDTCGLYTAEEMDQADHDKKPEPLKEEVEEQVKQEPKISKQEPKISKEQAETLGEKILQCGNVKLINNILNYYHAQVLTDIDLKHFDTINDRIDQILSDRNGKTIQQEVTV